MTERPTPLTDANAEALEAYRRKINEAARGPYGTTIRMPDPDAPQGIYELARTLERDRAELMEALSKLLDAADKEARTQLAAKVAEDNFTDAQPEIDRFGESMIRASVATKEARALLARLEGE